jgi:hypothetical protein
MQTITSNLAPGFDPAAYYESYPQRVIQRPGYPARAQYKSTLSWRLFGEAALRARSPITTYADIGGCFGFGANAMAFQIELTQKVRPKVFVFEIAKDFVTLGKQLFPAIAFRNEDFADQPAGTAPVDLVTMFDVIEHIPEPGQFLEKASRFTRLALLKTPMETSGEWRRQVPPTRVGAEHPDGHVNFFSPASYRALLAKSGFNILAERLAPSIVPPGAQDILCPEFPVLPFPLKSPKQIAARFVNWSLSRFHGAYGIGRKLFGGGEHLCLVRSRNVRS